ncbi:alpha/beta-hydrolase [Thozetella sp. PMI_491]|nr:alpha/beta-hydrolase [Thozetella sp. PMI_491]
MIFQVLPPFIRDVILHLLRLSRASSVLDLRTASRVALMRAVTRMARPGRLSDLQRASFSPGNVDAHIMHLETEISIPSENNVAEIFEAAFKSLGEGLETYTPPGCEPLSVEWIGGSLQTDELGWSKMESERIQYDAFIRTVPQSTTILYFHGGQFWRRGRGGRWATHELARQTEGRCLALQYRLSPLNPFPAALMDGLSAYLALLYPPRHNLHDPVSAQDIYLAGDSAGGNLVIALLKLIMEIGHLCRTGAATLVWDGQERDLPLPAAVTALSPYVDLARALDSEAANMDVDILPPRGPPFANLDRCGLWPASSPRHHVYCDDSALLHPLVSPVTVKDWAGAPPTWICVGEECLADQAIFVARQMAAAKVPIVLELFSAMPHNFPLLFKSESSTRSMEHWAAFIRKVRGGFPVSTGAIKWSGRSIQKEELQLEKLVPVSLHDLKARMKLEIAGWGPCPA